MQSDDLKYLQQVEEETVTVIFWDAEENLFTGTLYADSLALEKARQDKRCPKIKNSMEYYFYLMDEANAVPCSPNATTAALTKTDPDDNIIERYIYSVNAQGILSCAPCTNDEWCILIEHAMLQFKTEFTQQLRKQQLLLPAPRPQGS